jgi:hypothetical protein
MCDCPDRSNAKPAVSNPAITEKVRAFRRLQIGGTSKTHGCGNADLATGGISIRPVPGGFEVARCAGRGWIRIGIRVRRDDADRLAQEALVSP